jgi:hypothetical protein
VGISRKIVFMHMLNTWHCTSSNASRFTGMSSPSDSLIVLFFISLYILETSALTSAFGSSNTSVTSGSKKGSDKVLVENEVPPETLDYKRLDSQIANLREVIQNLRVKMKTKDNPVNNEKFETKVKEVGGTSFSTSTLSLPFLFIAFMVVIASLFFSTAFM